MSHGYHRRNFHSQTCGSILVGGFSVVRLYFQYSNISSVTRKAADPNVETGTGKSRLTLLLKIARARMPYHER